MRALGRKGDDDGTAETSVPGVEGQDANAQDALDLSDSWAEEVDTNAEPARFGWVAPALALLALAGWSGFFVWAHQGEMLAAPAPSVWASWVVEWAVPVALIGIVWLLAMRSSRAEAHRFAAVARQMNRESAALEARLKVVNRELSLAREFLAAQARDLEALGRIAAERISTHAGELQSLITSNGAQVEAIGTASETALGNMNRLRDDLPVIANAARDVANQIGSAGRVADDQLARLASGFDRLNEAGTSSEAQVTRLGEQVNETLGTFEDRLARIEEIASQRLAAVEAEAESFRTHFAALENEALAAQTERTRRLASEGEAIAARLQSAEDSAQARFASAVAALHETLLEKLRLIEQVEESNGTASRERLAHLRGEVERFDEELAERARRFAEMIEQRQAAFETHEAQASEVLGQRLAALDDTLAQRRDAQIEDLERLVAQGEALSSRVADLRQLMAETAAIGDTARTSLGAGLGTLAQQLAERRADLAETEAQLAQVTDSGVRLLEIIQAGNRTTRDDLAAAIAAASERLGEVEARAGKVEGLMLRNTQAGSDLSNYLLDTRSEIDAAEVAIAGFKSRLAEQSEDALARLQGLRGGFARLATESETLAGETQEQLRQALAQLEAAITQAFMTLDSGVRDKAAVLAQTIGGEAVAVLERALRNEAAQTIGKLEQSAAHASGVGREAAIQLRDQLVKVNELTGNLEQRVARARELAEEQVNNDFTRRMALITDSLNSAAIDITGALANEVSDTAWEAYLKGDRGIFTRRAVRLIDNGTAKDIAALYGADETFRVNVSRYIHDFEGLLRQTLSTRDGHVLSVTMLGSDMGKLYVALAQAIQRFRT